MAWTGSLLLHIAIGCAALFVKLPEPDDPLAKYNVKIVPVKDTKLIWYVQDQLPEISPRPVVKTETPPVEQRAPKLILAMPKTPQTGKQFVWRPSPQIQVQPDLNVPNILAVENKAAPPPPKPEPKKFVAPPAPKPAPTQQAGLMEAPKVAQPTQVGANSVIPARPVDIAAPKPKLFVPPPGSPAAGAGGGKPAEMPEAPALGTGPASVAVAAVGLRPVAVPEVRIPESSRPAAISAGPESGKEGGGRAGAVVVPDLTVQGSAPKPNVVVPAPKAPRQEPTPADWATNTAPGDSRAMARRMLSAGLRPGARVVPNAVESKFRQRVVYTTSFETAEAGRTVEWIVWFAEAKPAPDTPFGSVRPPVPWKKQDAGASSSAPVGNVQLAALILRDGSLASISVLKGREKNDDGAMQSYVSRWEFLPAVRNGAAFDVEVLLDLSFPP